MANPRPARAGHSNRTGAQPASVRRFSAGPSTQTQYVLHVVHARFLGAALERDKARRAQGPLRKVHPRSGPVSELDALALAGENDRLIAHDIATAQACEADGSFRALSGNAFACVDAHRLEITVQRHRRRLAELERGPGGSIDLVPMMHFDDLDIVIVTQSLRRD